MYRSIISALVPLALPIVVPWVWWQERRILREGRPLSEKELADARVLEIRDCQRIRILEVERIPLPGHSIARALSSRVMQNPPAGMTMRYGIFVAKATKDNRALLIHEMVHTNQYERLGGLWRFLNRYLRECVSEGYLEARLEKEARDRTMELLA